MVNPLLCSKHNISGIIESAPRNFRNDKVSKLKRFLRKAIGTPSLSRTAKEKGIPYFFLTRDNHQEMTAWLQSIRPDVMVVYSMSQLLKPEVFRIPKYGTLNLHPSALPSYRGPNPWFWMYYNQERSGAVTLHYIDIGEDTGDIVFQEFFDFPLGAKSPAMHDLAIGEIGVKLIFKALDSLSHGVALPRHPQPKKSPTKRARNLKKFEHGSVIDWNHWPVEKVWHLLRGTESWLDAVTPPSGLFSGQRWQVLEFEKHDCKENEISQRIGDVIKTKSECYIQCLDGKIFLTTTFNLKRFVRFILMKIFA